MTGLNSSIDYENVTFEYEKNVPVLNNFSLHINKGETIALVGNSGGGKSTTVNLLPRFYDVNSGSIKFDGIDIRDYEIDSLRNNISFVFQDNFLFFSHFDSSNLLSLHYFERISLLKKETRQTNP